MFSINKADIFFLVDCLETAYVTSQNEGQTQILSGKIVILAGHCPVTGRYFEPCLRNIILSTPIQTFWKNKKINAAN